MLQFMGSQKDFHWTGENRDSSLGGHKPNLKYTKSQRHRTVTPQETEPKLPASDGSPLESRSAGDDHRDRSRGGSSCLGRCPLAQTLLEVAINSIIESVDPRAGSPQDKKTTRVGV